MFAFLTVFLAAQIFRASRVLAHDRIITFHAAVVVGAHVARAEELAALALLALVIVTGHLVCVWDWSVASIAGNAVAVQRLWAGKGSNVDARFEIQCTCG